MGFQLKSHLMLMLGYFHSWGNFSCLSTEWISLDLGCGQVGQIIRVVCCVSVCSYEPDGDFACAVASCALMSSSFWMLWPSMDVKPVAPLCLANKVLSNKEPDLQLLRCSTPKCAVALSERGMRWANPWDSHWLTPQRFNSQASVRL